MSLIFSGVSNLFCEIISLSDLDIVYQLKLFFPFPPFSFIVFSISLVIRQSLHMKCHYHWQGSDVTTTSSHIGSNGDNGNYDGRFGVSVIDIGSGSCDNDDDGDAHSNSLRLSDTVL